MMTWQTFAESLGAAGIVYVTADLFRAAQIHRLTNQADNKDYKVGISQSDRLKEDYAAQASRLYERALSIPIIGPFSLRASMQAENKYQS